MILRSVAYLFVLISSISLLKAQSTESERNARKDLDYFKTERTKHAKQFKQHLYYGLGVEGGYGYERFGNYTSLALSPVAGWQAFNFLSIGPLLNYRRNFLRKMVSPTNAPDSYGTLSGMLFARFHLTNGLGLKIPAAVPLDFLFAYGYERGVTGLENGQSKRGSYGTFRGQISSYADLENVLLEFAFYVTASQNQLPDAAPFGIRIGFIIEQ